MLELRADHLNAAIGSMFKIIHGDCMSIMPTLPTQSFDAIVTDPPYDLTSGKKGGSGAVSLNVNSPAGRSRIGTGGGGFMGKSWDATGIAFDPATWRECLRVLRPGGHLLCFGGTRTFHRMAVAIEGAGFEIRDSICWLYGSGFPKSLDVGKAIDKAAGAEREVVGRYESPENTTGLASKDDGFGFGMGDMDKRLTAPATDAAKQWDGWGTALKPAVEIICVARKPLSEKTVAANVLMHGVGALNIDATRIEITDADREIIDKRSGVGFGTGQTVGAHQGRAEGRFTSAPGGRWPANLVLDQEAARRLDEQTGTLTSGKAGKGGHIRGEPAGEGIYGDGKGLWSEAGSAGELYGDSGGASRFFPVFAIDELDTRFRYCAKAPSKERPSYVNQDGDKISHATVKPVTLMRWLCRLVTPPGGLILDPFAGSGTTLEAAHLEGFQVIGIECEADYIPLIRARLAAIR